MMLYSDTKLKDMGVLPCRGGDSCNSGGSCTGNSIAPHLVLTAAHCVSLSANVGGACGTVTLSSIQVGRGACRVCAACLTWYDGNKTYCMAD